MLFIPLLCVFVALSLGKPENYRLPKWTSLLYIPTTLLLLLVLTNDLHQLVFVFPADAAAWLDTDHGYGSFDLEKAIAMTNDIRKSGDEDAYIAVIDPDDDFCVDEIREF